MQLIVKTDTPAAALERVGSKITVRSRYDNFIGGAVGCRRRKGHYFENRTPISGELDLRDRPLHRRGHREGARRRARRRRRLGQDGAGRPRRRPVQDRRPHGGEPAELWPPSRPSTTASRSARRWPPTCRSPSTTSATSPAASAPRKARSRRSTRRRSPTTSTSRSASSARSFPGTSRILMAVWKLAPALAAGNCVVLKPAEQTPMSIMVLMDLIGDLLPPGVLNVVNGFGVEAGKPLASEPAHRQDRLHRRDDDRPPHHAVRVGEHHPRHAGAGRQVAEHLLRRRA